MVIVDRSKIEDAIRLGYVAGVSRFESGECGPVETVLAVDRHVSDGLIALFDSLAGDNAVTLWQRMSWHIGDVAVSDRARAILREGD